MRILELTVSQSYTKNHRGTQRKERVKLIVLQLVIICILELDMHNFFKIYESFQR